MLLLIVAISKLGSGTNVVVDDYCEGDSSVVLYRKQNMRLFLEKSSASGFRTSGES